MEKLTGKIQNLKFSTKTWYIYVVDILQVYNFNINHNIMFKLIARSISECLDEHFNYKHTQVRFHGFQKRKDLS